jgi:hypothetical protein
MVLQRFGYEIWAALIVIAENREYAHRSAQSAQNLGAWYGA